MAAPKLVEGQVTTSIRINMTVEMKQRLDNVAKSEGLTTSHLIRALIQRGFDFADGND